jgi:hypothetical protein
MAERWSDPASERSTPRPIPRSSLRPSQRYEEPARRGSDPLEQGIDRLVSAGRQLVDGVSGARPGSRKPARGATASPGMRPRLGELGRWVEDKLDWILEDDDDWREPWQGTREPVSPVLAQREAPPADAQSFRLAERSSSRSQRRPLEAISRRGQLGRSSTTPAEVSPAAQPLSSGLADQDWPDDDSFSRPRWQRSSTQSTRQSLSPLGPAAEELDPERQFARFRPVPRSSRRRQPD